MLIFSLSFICSAVEAQPESKYIAEIELKSPFQGPIEAMAKNGSFIYSDSRNLYIGTKRIDLMNSFISSMQENPDDRKIYQILIDGQNNWLATNIGLFKNYKRVFSKGAVREIVLGRSQIFIASDTGIYSARRIKKSDYYDYKWQLLKGSPADAIGLSLNIDEDFPEFCIGEHGVYYYDPKQIRWLQRNAGLKKDFNNSYGFRKILVIRDQKLVLLSSSSGLYMSKDLGLNWHKASSGLQSNPDGFFSLRDLIVQGTDLFLASGQGLYYLALSELSSRPWSQIELLSAKTQENHSPDIYSLLSHHDKIYAGTSQGEIYYITGLKPTLKGNASSNAVDLIRKLLSLEPSVQEVQRVALDFAGLPAGKDFRRYRRQARLRHLVPNIEAFGTHNFDDILSIQSSGGDSFSTGTGSLTSSFDKDNNQEKQQELSTGLKAEWQLSQLIYDPEINDINNNARIVSNIRENLLTELTQIYFARRELQYQILNDFFQEASELSKALKDKLKLAEYTAQIDARTGSWFSLELNKRYEGGEYDKYFGV